MITSNFSCQAISETCGWILYLNGN